MKSFIAASILALASSTIAAPTERAAATPYTLEATKTNSFGELDKVIHANDYRFWVNKKTNSFCPSSVKAENGCPAGNVTSFVTTAPITNLNVEVPGGQEIFIQENGIVSWTVPHSGDIPAGATSEGVKNILLGDRIWLCNENQASDQYFVTVAKNSTALPHQAGANSTCTRTTLVQSFIKTGVSAWEYE